ncbi:MAG: hypothetical protein R2856_31210 [Caldilineaceae bacterium]
MTIYTIVSLQRSVLAADAFYQATAFHRKTRLHQRLRSGHWSRRVPSIQRGIDRLGGSVDRLIVAQGLSPEKLIAHADPLTPPQRKAATLLQVMLACACVVLIWLNWPNSAAAPITVNVERTSTASAAVDLVDVSTASSVAESPVLVVESDTVAETADIEELQAAPVVLIGEQPGAKPDVESVLAQVNANIDDDEVLELPGYTAPLSVDALAPQLDQVTEANADAALVAPVDAQAADPQAQASATILNQLEAAIAKAIEDAASKTENAPLDNLVVVEPQVQPKSQEPVAAAVAPSTNYPFSTVLGPEWESFAPLPAAEIDHYWLGLAFPPGYNQFYSPSYQFGSTAGGRYRPHHGVDISNPTGTPVLAMAGGEIIHAGPDNPTLLGPYNNFYGNSVVVRLDRTLSTPRH